jgi:NADH:ubiquinone oxidoreductase subunit E
MRIPSASIFGIATFYAQFHLKPRGKNIITTCCGTACHVKGSERLLDYTRRECRIPEHDDTSEDKVFTVQKVACVGACSIAPVVIVNKQVHGKVTSDKILKEIERLKKEQ